MKRLFVLMIPTGGCFALLMLSRHCVCVVTQQELRDNFTWKSKIP